MDFNEILNLTIVQKFQVLLQCDKDNGTLHEDLSTFMIVSCTWNM